MRCLVLLAAGCSASSPTMDAGPPDLAPSNPLVAARPYQYRVPAGYDPATPAPLVMLLHGYGVNGVLQDAVFGFSAFADANGILYAFPDGTKDQAGNRFWNATDACCNFYGSDVDDVAYLTAVLDDMAAHFNVDARRVFVTGHSNGGYMSHRLACDRADRIAAIVPLAGDDWKDTSRCQPSAPVAVLQVHGDQDADVPYGGDADTPSAHDSVAGWAALDGCGATPASGQALDLDSQVAGAETRVERWPCTAGAAELWTIQGAGHVPHLNASWPASIYGFMSAHPKPSR